MFYKCPKIHYQTQCGLQIQVQKDISSKGKNISRDFWHNLSIACRLLYHVLHIRMDSLKLLI